MELRAGYKLEAAIEQLGVDVEGKVALDSGLSTGGFTDCLLKYGASFVYGVDVGYGQVNSHIFTCALDNSVRRSTWYLPFICLLHFNNIGENDKSVFNFMSVLHNCDYSSEPFKFGAGILLGSRQDSSR